MSDKVMQELLSLEKCLGLKRTNKFSTQGDKKVPILQANNGPSLMGLTAIAAHLVQEAQQKQLLGRTAEEKAIMQQWLEYRVTQIDGHRGKDETRTILKTELAVQEKEKYVNVSRWFDHIQNYPGIRQHLPPVVMMKNRLYTSGH
ncbi:eukaryotic translation elongation factor 1 epsilon-1 isoform X2 [Polyodon spathula]|uniref:eukaryotic translation elongation factor 1 epsilon-1 isoform X2 n=1 Tax=Polyodon spathula TaxID=7913 RepID=UPI001B7E246B|nr:eukaryotic translation elongation factor 1 epsilon-1 isoform X2 [Polyodon spathula]